MTTQVLIVGAGPTGLMLASELARQKIDFRLIDKMVEPTTLSKAIALQARSLELLERFPGLVEELLQQGIQLAEGKICSEGQPLVHIDITKLKSRYPFVLSLPQCETEKLLRENLAAMGHAVEMQTELLSIEFAEDRAIVAHIRHADGHEEISEVEYLAACDGAHSVLRKQLNLSFQGSTFNDQDFMLADVTLNKEIPSNLVQVFLKSGAIVACFPLSKKRFRFIVEQPKSVQSEALTVAHLQKLLKEMVAPDLEIEETFWFSEFSINQRKTEKYRVGRVFLLGDAAHIHSPVGGQGMNTGMQDAINLGWKLAAVLNGKAKETLLETYAEERNKVGEALLRGTDFATKIVMFKNKFAIAIRNFVIKNVVKHPKMQQKIINNLGELTVNYRWGALSVGHSLGKEKIHPGDRWPDAMLGSSRWYEILSCDLFNIILINASVDTYRTLAKALAPFRDKLCCLGVQSTKDDFPGFTIFQDERLVKNLSRQASAIYVIRPDRYVAYCAEPINIDALVKYLEEWI